MKTTTCPACDAENPLEATLLGHLGDTEHHRRPFENHELPERR